MQGSSFTQDSDAVMRKFAIRLIILAVFVGVADAALNVIFSRMQNKARGMTGRTVYINDTLQTDIIVLGSSRALHHYDPKAIEDSTGMDCYNCGEDQMGIVFCYCRYRIISERKVPKVIIYDVEPDYDLLEWDNESFLGPLRPFYYHKGVDSVFWMIDPMERCKMAFNVYKYNSRLTDLLKDLRSSATYYHGYDPYRDVDEKGFTPESLPQNKFDTLKLRLLNRFINEVMASGNTMIIFTASPQLSYGSDSVFDGFKRMCAARRIPFFCHYSDMKYTSDKSLFHNSNHLNERGAALFSREVAGEVRTYLKAKGTLKK